jgi:hypothetical protein
MKHVHKYVEKRIFFPGANPTTVSYNASDIKIGLSRNGFNQGT